MNYQDRIIAIAGPTACKKSDLAIALCKRLNGEVVSTDSVQVYRGMDIGSAKPSTAQQKEIPHHMLDCVEINTPDFSVSQYRDMALKAVHGITLRGKLPIAVGGSGLYLNALISPLNFAVPRNEMIRDTLSAEYDRDRFGMFSELTATDPATANRLHPNDKKRIVRAMEVYRITGKPYSQFGNDFHNEAGLDAPLVPMAVIGLTMEREKLYRRIDQRVEQMMRDGLLEEARRIYERGYDPKLPAMQSIGYRQLFANFRGELSLDEAVEAIKIDTRHFAKRQMTWFRREPRIVWFDADRPIADLTDEVEQFIREKIS
jgi:tRNA dimethylallyltransferase